MTITDCSAATGANRLNPTGSGAIPEPFQASTDERLARLARRLFHAEGGLVYRYQGDRLDLRAVDGITSDQLAEYGRELACPVAPGGDDQGDEASRLLSAPLPGLDGRPSGYCCVWNAAPREWSAADRASLVDLARLSAGEERAPEREHTVRHAVTRILNEATTVTAALSEVLRVIAEMGGWDFGAYWSNPAGAAAETLRCDLTWRRSEAEAGFEAATRGQVFRAGERLPELALRSHRPIWLPTLEVETLVRRDAAREAGLRSAYAFPIRVGEVAIGALEFFSCETRESDDETLRDSSVLGGLIGQFIQRRRAQQELQEREEQLRFALDAGRLGTWAWNVRTNALHWSETLQRLHGLEPNSFPGDINAFLNDMHPDDRDRVLASVQNALAGGAEHHVEYRIVRPDGSQRWVLGMGRVTRDADGAPLRMSGVCMDITERKQSELSMEFLAEAGVILAASLDYQSTLSAVARLAVPTVADWCAVDLLAEDGSIQRLAVAHTDPEKVRYAYELERRYPANPNASHGVPQVLRSGKPEMMSEIPDSLLEATAIDAEHLAIARSLGLRSYLVAPLTARGRVFGAITLVSAESGRRFGAEELALGEELARRAAVAIDNARLFQEREQAEEKLRSRLEFIHAVTHSLEEGILAVDGGSRIIFVNPAAEVKLGYEPDALLGKPLSEVLQHCPAEGEAVRPFSLLDACEHGARTQRAGETFQRRDGSGFPVAYTCAPLRTGEANPGAVLLFEDVTEHRAAEAERARQAREAAMVADVGVALNHRGSLREVLGGCMDAVVRHVGAAFARVWTLNAEEQVLELEASSGIYTHLDGPHSRVPVGSFKIGRIAQERRPHLTNDVSTDPRIGNPEWARETGMVSFAGYPLVVEDRLVGVLALFARHSLAEDTLSALGAIADILAQGIERKRGEERISLLNTSLERRVRERTEALVEANRELESFSYSVSHDLRAPLRHVLGFADMLEKRSGGLLDENGRRYLRTIQESARHAGSLVDDLLAFSRMGRAELRHQRVSMDALVKQAQQDVLPELESRECAWSLDELPEVEGDAAMLRLVWRNLLSNAVKYTRGRERAEIRISAEAGPDEVVFTVRDNGVGFDMRYVDKLFGVFQRLHTADEFEGTGIGLANVRRIIQRHGGRTWAEGVVDEGSAFHFSLPRRSRTVEPLLT